MFCLPNFISIFFLVIALTNVLIALKELEETRAILVKTHRAFFELHRCVRQQVTYHNQKDAINYLLSFLQKGEKIKANYLTFKRPGIGISPIDVNKVIGKKLNRDLEANTVIHYKFLK